MTISKWRPRLRGTCLPKRLLFKGSLYLNSRQRNPKAVAWAKRMSRLGYSNTTLGKVMGLSGGIVASWLDSNKDRHRKDLAAQYKKKWFKTTEGRVHRALVKSRRRAKERGHKPCTANRKELLLTVVGRCEACTWAGRLCLDHCHRTGEFRGWLCSNCNTALGFAKDDPTLLERLASYLRRKVCLRAKDAI